MGRHTGLPLQGANTYGRGLPAPKTAEGVRKCRAKGNSPPTAGGQRWEAQRAAERCLETGGMMFERSEFLPPQALRQAASGEVCTDWKMSQSDSWICSANRQHWQHIVVRSADVVCTARDAKRQCCQLLAPNAVHDCPVFGTFLKKYRKQDYRMNIRKLNKV